jgi:EpsI family protein
LGILLLEMAVLKRIIPELDKGTQNKAENCGFDDRISEQKQYSGLFRHVSVQFLIILLLMGTTAAGVQSVSSRNRFPMQKSFSTFPDSVGIWSGKKQCLEKMYLDALELNDYLLSDYRNSRGEVVNAYVAYSDFQSKGKASHSPATCLPGSGWELKEPVKIAVTDGSGRTVTINRTLMVMGSERRLVYYWFDQRGRTLTDLYQIKLFNVVDSITLNRTDGALIRLITPLTANESPEVAEVRLEDFFRQFNPELSHFLPASARL